MKKTTSNISQTFPRKLTKGDSMLQRGSFMNRGASQMSLSNTNFGVNFTSNNDMGMTKRPSTRAAVKALDDSA